MFFTYALVTLWSEAVFMSIYVQFFVCVIKLIHRLKQLFFILNWARDMFLYCTSGFCPRVRARALRAPVFLGSWPLRTWRCAPPRPSQLRCFLFNPQKYLQSIELGPPTSRASFFPMNHRGYEIWGPLPHPAHRSFADPSGNIFGVKLCSNATIRPNFFVFYSFWIFFCYSLLFLLSFSLYSYSSLLISSYSSRRCYSSSSYSSFFWSIFATIPPTYFCFFSSFLLIYCPPPLPSQLRWSIWRY